MADWSALPIELLQLISLLLTTSIDLFRFRSVCANWRAAIRPPHNSPTRSVNLPRAGPLYLAKCSTYALQSHNCTFWIIKLLPDTSNCMQFLHPLALCNIRHPSTFPKSFNFMNLRIKELSQDYTLVSFNSTPSGTDVNPCMFKHKVLGSLGNEFVILLIAQLWKLVLYKSGEDEFRKIDDTSSSEWKDLILMRGIFFAVDNTGRLARVNHVDYSIVEIISSDPVLCGNKKLLVDNNGDLVLVDMYFMNLYPHDWDYDDYDDYLENEAFLDLEMVEKLEVFSMDEDASKWVKLNNLGDRILFVGNECSFSASAKDFSGKLALAREIVLCSVLRNLLVFEYLTWKQVYLRKLQHTLIFPRFSHPSLIGFLQLPQLLKMA